MSTTNAPKLDSLRKVAILVSALDQRAADQLLDHLPAEQARRVRHALMELDEVPRELSQSVLEEFFGTGQRSGGDDVPRATFTGDEGAELEASLAKRLASPDYEADLSRVRSTAERPFRFLREATTAAIVRHLRHENPQVVAVVIAHLPPSQAAEVIASFEPRAQADVLRRVAELGTPEPDMLREVEQHLYELLCDDILAAKNREAGVSTVSSIIQAAGQRARGLVASLRQHDQELSTLLPEVASASANADESSLASSPVELSATDHSQRSQASGAKAVRVAAAVAPRSPVRRPSNGRGGNDIPPVAFSDLYRLEDTALTKVFHHADGQLVLFALAGASPAFVNRLLKQLPSRDARRLQRRMEQLGPLRLSDIEQAQDRLAELASRLAAAGDIELPEPKRFAAAV